MIQEKDNTACRGVQVQSERTGTTAKDWAQGAMAPLRTLTGSDDQEFVGYIFREC